MKVNTIIIGAGRSGTTSIYQHLENHPDVCFSSIKEIHYFSQADLFSRGDKYLHSFFKSAGSETILATADTYLLIDYDAIKRIYQYNPQMKIIVLLRDPIDRAYSSFQYSINFGYQKKTETFLEAFSNEAERIRNKSTVLRNNLGHFYSGLYSKHLSEWHKIFPNKNFLILLTKDLKEKKSETLNQLYTFLRLSAPNKKESDIKTNRAAKPKFVFLQQLLLNRELPIRKLARNLIPEKAKQLIFKTGILNKLHKLNKKEYSYEPLSDEIRDQVKAYFTADLLELETKFGIKI